jgi:glutamate 5-kinase
LSALIAQITDADLLLLLSDVEGLFDKDPHKNPDARIIRLVEKIDEKIGKMAGGTRSEQSTGGMQSKLEAVKKASAYGIPTMIVRGGTKEIILKAIRGEKVGTLFQPARKLARNKWWTAFAFKVKGKILIDKGAEQAVLVNKKSLLPAGIKGVKGDFSRGDCVELINMEGGSIAKGVANYSAADILKIKGLKSMEIEKKLGYAYAEEVVHRDNMVVL